MSKLKLCKQIKGGKRARLVGGPGNGMVIILDGRVAALKYEVKGKEFYYKWAGLTDGKCELFSFLGGVPDKKFMASPSMGNPMEIGKNWVQQKNSKLYLR